MLPKSQKIKRDSFRPLLASKNYTHSPHFLLKIASNNGFRAAISVSKKVSKKAVTRNRVRRRAYAALEGLRGTARPALYLFVAKVGADKLETREIVDEFASLIKKS